MRPISYYATLDGVVLKMGDCDKKKIVEGLKLCIFVI
jgi:hypothetical protein